MKIINKSFSECKKNECYFILVLLSKLFMEAFNKLVLIIVYIIITTGTG